MEGMDIGDNGASVLSQGEWVLNSWGCKWDGDIVRLGFGSGTRISGDDGAGVGSGLTVDSGSGGSGGRPDRYFYIFVYFRYSGLDGGGKGSSSLFLELLVLTMERL